MKILGRLLALFLIMPIVELALLIQVDKLIGFWPTIGVIVLTGVIGSYLAKREGLAVWRRFNEQLGRGALPGKQVVDGIIILCAGALLITPGVLTDLLGFMGLFPPTRALIRKEVMRRVDRALRKSTLEMRFGSFGGMGFDVPEPERSAYWGGTPQDAPRHARDLDDPGPEPSR